MMVGRTRRDYGSGSVHQRCEARFGCPDPVKQTDQNGKTRKVRPEHNCQARWYGVIDAGWTQNGTRRRITVSAKTQAEAKVKLRNKVKELDDHGDTGLDARTTVKAWAQEWLQIVVRDLSPSSYNSGRSAIRIWIIPTIGHIRLNQLTPSDVRKVAAAQREAGRTSSTQRRTHSVLIQMLKAAQLEGHAVPARLLSMDPPNVAVNDRTSISVPEAVKMLQVAAEQPDGARWAAAFLQGLRQAERLGLTWDEVDFENNVITIGWQLKPLPYNRLRDTASGFRVPDGYEAKQIRGRWHLVRPKTKAGRRKVPMVPWLRTALEAWREQGHDHPGGLVWHTPVGDPQKLDDAAWKALQEEAGVRHPEGRHYTIHEARHTTATLLLEAGTEPVVVAAILGQSKMLTDYIHLSTAPMKKAMDKVATQLALVGPEVA